MKKIIVFISILMTMLVFTACNKLLDDDEIISQIEQQTTTITAHYSELYLDGKNEFIKSPAKETIDVEFLNISILEKNKEEVIFTADVQDKVFTSSKSYKFRADIEKDIVKNITPLDDILINYRVDFHQDMIFKDGVIDLYYTISKEMYEKDKNKYILEGSTVREQTPLVGNEYGIFAKVRKEDVEHIKTYLSRQDTEFKTLNGRVKGEWVKFEIYLKKGFMLKATREISPRHAGDQNNAWNIYSDVLWFVQR